MISAKIIDMLTSAVTVVTVNSDGKLNGMTVAWISQVSFNPVMIAVSIAPTRFTYGIIKKTNMFGVNILHQDAVEAAKHFGYTSGKDIDKFQNIQCSLNPSGLPILEKDITYFMEAKLVSSCDAGDHKVIIAQILDINKFSDNSPLIFRSSDFF